RGLGLDARRQGGRLLSCGLDRRGQIERYLAAQRIASHAKSSKVGLVEVEHPNDVRRQRQNDVRLLRALRRVSKNPADDWNVRETWDSVERLTLVISDETGEHVRLAVPEADDG